jgi:hypothetical protein
MLAQKGEEKKRDEEKNEKERERDRKDRIRRRICKPIEFPPIRTKSSEVVTPPPQAPPHPLPVTICCDASFTATETYR